MSFNIDDWLEDFEKTAEDTSVGQEKLAAARQEGEVMAHAFIDELTKIAVGDSPITPDTGSVKRPEDINKVDTGVQLKKEKVDKVSAILNNLTASTKAGVGEIATPAGAVLEAQTPYDEAPLPADAQTAADRTEAINKVAAETILTNLYNKYFIED